MGAQHPPCPRFMCTGEDRRRNPQGQAVDDSGECPETG